MIMVVNWWRSRKTPLWIIANLLVIFIKEGGKGYDKLKKVKSIRKSGAGLALIGDFTTTILIIEHIN